MGGAISARLMWPPTALDGTSDDGALAGERCARGAHVQSVAFAIVMHRAETAGLDALGAAFD